MLTASGHNAFTDAHKRPTLLAGIDPNFVQKVNSVRNAIDRRVVRAIHKDKVVSEKTRKAIRQVRLGNMSALRLLHLLDKDDNGTTDNPLKSFGSMPAAAASKLALECFSTLTEAITFATPTQTATAMPFLSKLRRKICDAIEAEVPMSYISTYYSSVMLKVTQPVRSYAFNEGGSGSAVFDESFITAITDESTELERAWQDKRATKAAAAEAARNGKRPLQEAQQDLRQKLQNRNQTVQRANGVSAGAAVPLPKDGNGKPDKEKIAAWQKSKGLLRDAKDKSGKYPCWDFYHPQGCARGASCSFYHK